MKYGFLPFKYLTKQDQHYRFTDYKLSTLHMPNEIIKKLNNVIKRDAEFEPAPVPDALPEADSEPEADPEEIQTKIQI
ncbi:uncharacterized protein OCT59_016696 [Rhizophagus irregularis]|uniref:uncharacterized protein n=1 Tax=Rhizophagus irregularis TaxID=588596 RepID=UPI001A00E025|nr:hypothetical protein OCT59_016696 [Rhizophagus irregularis]GBC15033.2 hypothetical protein RIR_jg10149.t1 [Rhizophagus irregularis DAOM 181602=DAOM 197198]CAB4476544.1 unnamed protein product [Rhizophagus irregularis]CAB5189474.1 unnamed protein product [Rhizophagus irregularis]